MFKQKRGQMMMVGVLVLVMSILVFISTLPAIQGVVDETRGCSSLNCAGYVDTDASGDGCAANNQSYLPSGNSNALSCTIIDLMIPFLILGILIAVITMLMSGRLMDQPQPQYGAQY